MRNENGQFVKGYGFWTGKKRPGLVIATSFQAGQTPWNKGKRASAPRVCLYCLEPFDTNRSNLTKPHQQFCSVACRGAARRGQNYGKKVTKLAEYRKWRLAVLARDKCCVWCGSTDNLQADHIKPKSIFPELMFDLLNGRALCFGCHKKTPTYGAKARTI